MLARLLWCAGCEYPFAPARLSQPPAYACSGCRNRVDAIEIERLVSVAAERHAPALTTGVPAECLAHVYQELITRIVVDAASDDLAITWRI